MSIAGFFLTGKNYLYYEFRVSISPGEMLTEGSKEQFLRLPYCAKGV